MNIQFFYFKFARNLNSVFNSMKLTFFNAEFLAKYNEIHSINGYCNISV